MAVMGMGANAGTFSSMKTQHTPLPISPRVFSLEIGVRISFGGSDGISSDINGKAMRLGHYLHGSSSIKSLLW